MSDHPNQGNTMKHLKGLAQLVGTIHGEWSIFTFIEGMVLMSTEPQGILEKVKQKYQLTEYITLIFEQYYTKLKPLGGSFAGAKRPITTTSTRAADASGSSPRLEDDPTGDSNMTQVLKDIALDKILDDRGKQELNEAAAYFKLILEKALDDPFVGLRRNADKFMSFQPSGMSNAYEILDEIISELRPLEIIIMGPDVLLAQEFTHSTRFAPGLRIDEIMTWRDTLQKSFRSSTPTSTMSDTLLMERKPHLQHLTYLTSKNFEFRLKSRPGGESVFHAVRTEILPLITKIATTPRMTATEILTAMRPVLKMYPGTNLKTSQWVNQGAGGAGNKQRNGHHPQAHAAQSSPSNTDTPGRAFAARFAGDTHPKRRDDAPQSDRPQIRAHDNKPKSNHRHQGRAKYPSTQDSWVERGDSGRNHQQQDARGDRSPWDRGTPSRNDNNQRNGPARSALKKTTWA